MIRTSLRKTLLVPLAALGAILALSCGTAVAQTMPFAITGVGTAPQGIPLPGEDPLPHNIVGVATHLGLHVGSGVVQTNSFTSPTTGKFQGRFTFQSLNSDKLVCDYGNTDAGATTPGTFKITPVSETTVEVEFLAEFVVDPVKSTGKFKGVKGSWLMYAKTKPFVLGNPFEYGWAGVGFLKFPKN